MTEVFVVLIVCTLLAYVYNNNAPIVGLNKEKHYILRESNVFAHFSFILLIFYMVWFAGLRTRMNDTTTYINKFNNLYSDFSSAIKSIDWSIGANPLFYIYRIVIKCFISDSGYSFIFITSALVVSSFLLFIKKHSVHFGYSVFIFVSFTVYGFTMAAMKQTMATAIGIWAISLIIRNKRIKAVILIIIAMLIHPYVVIYFAAFFLKDNIWDKKTIFLIVLTILAGLSFTAVIDFLYNTASSAFGDDYYSHDVLGGGVSFFRRMVYLVVPILSFITRKKLREEDNLFYNITINLSIVSALIMMLSGIGGAILIARLANYYDIFICLAVPIIIFKGLQEESVVALVYRLSFPCYTFFYYSYYKKYMILGDHFYDRISFFELLRNW